MIEYPQLLQVMSLRNNISWVRILALTLPRRTACTRSKAADFEEWLKGESALVFLRENAQLHWKSYNEAPKGPISKRALTTDIKGEWHLEYEPLDSLKSALRELKKRRVGWWEASSESVIERTGYPVTASADEWANELMNLDQMLVEGFKERWLRKKAESLDRQPDVRLGSLKLLRECLIGLGFEEQRAGDIVAPLEETRWLRTKLKGHRAGKEAEEARKKALEQHQSYHKHFYNLCERCDESVRTLAKAFGSALTEREEE